MQEDLEETGTLEGAARFQPADQLKVFDEYTDVIHGRKQQKRTFLELNLKNEIRFSFLYQRTT